METTLVYTQGGPGRESQGEDQSHPRLFLWLVGFLIVGYLSPENLAGMLWGRGRECSRTAPGPAEGRQAAKLLGPASSHLPQSSGPNTERVKRERTFKKGDIFFKKV